jgi:undecaprenyl-diphosphatase
VTPRRALGAPGWLGVAASGAGLLVACALVARDGTVGAPERSVFHAVNDLPGWRYPGLWPFQQFGNLVVALRVGVAVAAWLRKWWVAAAVLGAVVLKLAGEKLVKELVERNRPGTSIGGVHQRGDVSAHGLSFVSGHAVITTAIAGLLTPLLPRGWKALPWVVVVLNGIARIYVGAHNPLDVLGGVGLGLVIAGGLNAILVRGEPAPAP